MLFSKYQAIPYDVHHKQCERKYIHFVSRIAVISSSVNNSQQFYQSHSRKISSMCMHPSKMIVATAEADQHPSIHIWSVLDLAPLSIFKTQHENGVVNMRFSFDGFYLISISADKSYSIQVTNWREEELVCFRNTSHEPVLDLVVDPYNKYKFATCGYDWVKIWQIDGKGLLITDSVKVSEAIGHEIYITCIEYIYYL